MQVETEAADGGNVIADKTGEIDVSPAMALERIDAWVDGTVKLIPNIIVALIIFAIFIGLAFLAKKIIVSRAQKRDRKNLGTILGGFVKAAILILGGMLALTIVVPSLKPGDLVAGLGVSSVAIGFAFKDILQNWLAGLLILIRQPFEVGDQVEVNGYEGTVDHIETRATIIKTYDGQKAVIPNSDIYTNAVLVRTGYDMRRSQYDIGIGYGDDVETAQRIIKETIANIEGVENEPAPQAIPWDLAASWVTIRARWWTDSRRVNVVTNRGDVILAIKRALDDAGVDMPYETQVHLFHDQTEDRDGQPGEQREGWPAPSDKDVKPRYKVVKDADAPPSSKPPKAEAAST